MRRAAPQGLIGLAAVLAATALSCASAPEERAARRAYAGAPERTARRAYASAPPVIPHVPFGASCESCHNERSQNVPDVGFAPASPHDETAGMAGARCRQCHVFQVTDTVFRASRFEGERPPAGRAPRAHPGAPPVVPHPRFMRESCLACHDGPAARPEIRTTHPERSRCEQCHVGQRTVSVPPFAPS